MKKKAKRVSEKKIEASRKSRVGDKRYVKRKKSTPGINNWVPTPEIISRVELYASRHLNKKHIAALIGIGYSTLFDKINEYPEFAKAFEHGEAMGIVAVANAHYSNAISGSVAAQQFILRTKGEFHETTRVETTGKDGGPIEVVNAEQSAARDKIAGLLAGIAARIEAADNDK